MGSQHRYADLRLPADARLLRVARVAAASMAAELPFTLQDIEDLRIAVDELAAAAIEGCSIDDELDVRFELRDGGLVVTGRVAGAGAPPEMHAVAADLLSLVAGGHEIGEEDGDRVFRFTKLPAPRAVS